MKILLVNKFLYPKGGDAISTITTGALLDSKGHEVNYWGMDHPSNPTYPLKDYFISNVDFSSSGAINKQIVMAANLLYSFEAKWKIEKVLAYFKPDIVHLNNFAHQISPSILDVLEKHSIPAVMTMRDYKMVCPVYTMVLNEKPCEKCAKGIYVHCALNNCTKGSFSKSLLNTLEMYLHHNIMHIYDSIHTYISPSLFLMNKCQEMGFKHRMAFLPNFVNLATLSPDFTFKGPRAIYMGRLAAEKGVLTLLQAVSGTNIQLDIVGGGPLHADFENQARIMRLSNVTFWGYLTGEALYNRVREASVLVIPSEWYENNPRSVIEAFALGKPVVGARIGGIPELVRDNVTGLTFTSGSSEDLRSKLFELLSKPDAVIQMGKNGRQLVETELNSENHYSKLMEIYRNAITSIS